jgi:hypothetical protein
MWELWWTKWHWGQYDGPVVAAVPSELSLTPLIIIIIIQFFKNTDVYHLIAIYIAIGLDSRTTRGMMGPQGHWK